KRKRTLPPNISDILLGQNRYNNFQWEDVSSRVLVRRFIHQEILVPFFQGFSWAIGMHLYRYLRYGFSLRSLWRNFYTGITGNSTNVQR
ncbi:4033_t:CDS:1, partial [Cetraspora pellucida]